MKPTNEQQAVIDAAQTGQNLRISARAGAGKTSTLVMVANSIEKPSLYLAYNKAMAEEARSKFPEHVEVRTTHSLAYAHIGHEYQHKLSRPRGAYVNVAATGSEIGRYYRLKAIPLSGDKKLTSAAIGLAIKLTVGKFEYSADKQLGEKHLPTGLIEEYKRKRGFVESTFRKLVLKHAKLLWKDRTDIDSDVMCTHDTYMKLFQLSNPVLNGYDIIYLDEAQDSNACLLDIFTKQTAQKVAVGDGFQAIYQWRGSVNAMEKLAYTELELTQSFRFGEGVASIATEVLRDRNTREVTTVVEGLPSIKDDVGLDIEMVYPYTILYRTNAALLGEAVNLILKNVKVNIESDMKDFVKMLTSALALYKGQMRDVKHEEITPFSTWQELETEAKYKGELSRIATIIKNGSALRYLKVLETHYNTDKPEVTLTTAHKAKGREWDAVVLADDFPSPYDSKGKWIGLEDMERNLLYVAATRAKTRLRYNDAVEDMLSLGGLSNIDIGNVRVTKYTGLSTPTIHSKSDGACDAINRATDEVEQYEAYMNGEVSDVEAYDLGVIDENGSSIDSTNMGLLYPN
jgi:superfamily I DNA/RNA helicase